jgi:hypothetical protein
MDTFRKLFGSLLALVYHCFDRIVIQGYLPLLTREEHIVHLFRDVHGIYPITKQALAVRTQERQQWVEAFARNHRIPIEWTDNQALNLKPGADARRLRAPVLPTHGTPQTIRAVFHLQKPRQGSKISRHHPKGADDGSRLSSHPPDTRPV